MIQGFDSDSPPTPAPVSAQVPVPDAEPTHTTAPTPPSAANRRPRRRWQTWWLLPALLLLGFGLLAWQVRMRGPVVTLDARVRDHIQAWAKSPSMNWTFHPGRAMADLGNQSVSLLFLLGVTALAIRAARSWRPALVTAGGLAALATVIPLKIWIGRPGPSQTALGDAQLGFFPSGHTADAILCYGTSALLLCAFVVPDGPRARRLRQAITAAACVLVAAVIFGLLWSNFHWLSDTVGSLCWCGAALVVLVRLTANSRRARARPHRPTAYPR